jgi:hypothetical protein
VVKSSRGEQDDGTNGRLLVRAVALAGILAATGTACGGSGASAGDDTTTTTETSTTDTSTTAPARDGGDTTGVSEDTSTTSEPPEPAIGVVFSTTLTGWGGVGVDQVQDGSESFRDEAGHCSGYHATANGSRQEMATASVKQGATIIVYDADGKTELARATLPAGVATINERDGEFWRCDFKVDLKVPKRDSYRVKIGDQGSLRRAVIVNGVLWAPVLRTRPTPCPNPGTDPYQAVAGTFLTRASRALCAEGITATYAPVCAPAEVAPGVVVRVRSGDNVVESLDNPPPERGPQPGDKLTVEYASGAPCS